MSRRSRSISGYSRRTPSDRERRLEETYLDIPPYRLRVLLGGAAGRPLMLLLASPVIHAGLYRRTASEFAENVRIAVVDLPGSGKASRVKRPLRMEELADLVPALIGAVGSATAVLIGHSCSGAVALHAAVRHPEQVTALVLADSIGAHPKASLGPIVLGRAWDAVLEPRTTLTGGPAVARNLIFHPATFANQVSRSADTELLHLAAHVAVPTLLAWGARDHTMPLAAADRFQAAIPHAKKFVSETGSHDWIIEQPVRFAEAVRRELAIE